MLAKRACTFMLFRRDLGHSLSVRTCILLALLPPGSETLPLRIIYPSKLMGQTTKYGYNQKFEDKINYILPDSPFPIIDSLNSNQYKKAMFRYWHYGLKRKINAYKSAYLVYLK